MQELRVVQTGVQLLTGFLVTLPFQSRFADLSEPWRVLYLVIMAASLAATVCLTAPVAAHRMLFRRGRLASVVLTAHRYAIAGLCLLGITLTGVAALIFDAVAGARAGVVAGAVFGLTFTVVWMVHPLRQRRTTRPASGSTVN